MHMLHSVNMSLCISNVGIPVLRSETEPLVLQFIYVFRDQDTFIVALICVIYHFLCFTLLQLLILHHGWYFVFIILYMIPCSTTFVIFVQYLLYIIFVCVVFTLINKYDTFQWLLRYVHTHARTHSCTLRHTK